MELHKYIIQKAWGRALVIIAIIALMTFGFWYWDGDAWQVTYLKDLLPWERLIVEGLLVIVVIALSWHIVQEWAKQLPDDHQNDRHDRSRK